jgi:hypothetical protein
MRTNLVKLILALSLLLPIGASAEEWRFPGDRITFDQWVTYFDELANAKGAIMTEEPEYYIINLLEEPTHRALFVFTKPKHPAYPAVVIRSVEADEDGSVLARRGHYAGDKAKFDVWWHEFDALDKQNIDDASDSATPSRP